MNKVDQIFGLDKLSERIISHKITLQLRWYAQQGFIYFIKMPSESRSDALNKLKNVNLDNHRDLAVSERLSLVWEREDWNWRILHVPAMPDAASKEKENNKGT